VALQPKSPLKSFSTSKENRDSNHYNIFYYLDAKIRK
jgi:hypothetical protein